MTLRGARRIHIVGATGSGKTFLAERLSERLGIRYCELDTVMWNGREEFAGKRSAEERDKLFAEVISDEAWIVEGIYYKWVEDSFRQADAIVYMDTPRNRRLVRIVLRFLKQRLGAERSVYKQTLRGLFKMIAFNHRFDRTNKPRIFAALAPYRDKVTIMKGRDRLKLGEWL